MLFRFEAQGFHLLLQIAYTRNRTALLLPAGAQAVDLLLERRKLALDHVKPRQAVGIRLALEGGALDFERSRFALQLVDFRRHTTDLNGQRGSGFVDQIDSLVGQEAVGDVAMRERGRGDDGRVLDADVVVRFVALAQPAQDGDGVFDVGLAHVY